MPTGSFGRGGLMLQDPKPPMNPKETSLMTHPDASTKMHDINLKKYGMWKIYLKKANKRKYDKNVNKMFIFQNIKVSIKRERRHW